MSRSHVDVWKSSIWAERMSSRSGKEARVAKDGGRWGIHRVSDAIQPSQPLSSPSPLAPNPSQYGASLWGLGVPHLPGRVPENQVGEALHLEAPQRKERVLRAARSPVQEPGMEWKSGELRCNQEHRAGGPGLPPSPPTPTALQGTPANARDMGLIPRLGRSSGGGHGNPLQYSCLGNPMDRGAWRFAVHGVAKSRTRLSD